MYDETNVPGPEYRVRPVVRYVVTRYCHPFTSSDGKSGSAGHSEVIAEFHSDERAHEVAAAMGNREGSLVGLQVGGG
jgi:hypothetical protein